LDSLQTSLTLIGMVPGLGAVADVLNAGLYVLRGDYANAAMSAASIVPFVGIFGTVGRFGNRAAHALEAGADIVRVAENASSAVRASDAATDLVRAAEFASSTERVTETGATALRTAENVGPSVGAVRAETRVLEGEEFMAELTSRYNAEKASMDSGHFVDFSDYVHTDVNIGSLRGSRRADFSAADAIAASERPGWRRPPHHTWHHHEDLGRMQLVPTRVHRGRGLDHAGGVSIWLRVFGRQSRRGY
jgi:hypothetical protein